MTTKTGTVIRVQYSVDSLNDIDPNAFEAELYDALRKRWPGALVSIAQSINNWYWGIIDDETEIDGEEIKRIGEEVFCSLCRAGA